MALSNVETLLPPRPLLRVPTCQPQLAGRQDYGEAGQKYCQKGITVQIDHDDNVLSPIIWFLILIKSHQRLFRRIAKASTYQ
jgi:hypothetical protein